MTLLKFFNKSKKDTLFRNFYKRSELSKLVLKSLLASPYFFLEDRLFFYKKFLKFNFKSSISFYFRSCLYVCWV